MKNSKKILALLAAVAMMATLFAGCGNGNNNEPPAGGSSAGGGEETSSYKIAVVPKMTSIGWFERMEEGVNDYNATSANGNTIQYGGSSDGADQASYVEGLLAEDWDAICVVPFQSESLAPVLERALGQGIVVIAHEAASMDPAYFSYDIEAFQAASYGENFAKQLIDLTGGQGKYLQLVGDLTSVSHNEWCDAADAYFAANAPEMTKLDRVETKDDVTQAYNKVKEILQANPDVTAIEGSASTDVQGAAQAVAELGKAGQIAIVGTSMTSICGAYVEDGTIASFSVWDPAEAGKAMIELAIAVLDAGGEIDVANTHLNASGYENLTADASVPTVVYGDARVDVTKDNMADYNF